MIAISEQTLLEGSWHALAQAGRLLRSAVLLLDSGDASSALVLAMFVREELGRSRLLRICAGEVNAGQLYTPCEIAAKCDDHVAKQEASAYEAKRKRQPDDRHETLCDGLYVDLDEAGTSWQRPADLNIEDARKQITDEANDYSRELDRLSREGLFDSSQPQNRGKEMQAARQQRARFDVPAACWPKHDVVSRADPRKQSWVRRLWRASTR
jgi:AbiV family abortive infection protein